MRALHFSWIWTLDPSYFFYSFIVELYILLHSMFLDTGWYLILSLGDLGDFGWKLDSSDSLCGGCAVRVILVALGNISCCTANLLQSTYEGFFRSFPGNEYCDYLFIFILLMANTALIYICTSFLPHRFFFIHCIRVMGEDNSLMSVGFVFYEFERNDFKLNIQLPRETSGCITTRSPVTSLRCQSLRHKYVMYST